MSQPALVCDGDSECRISVIPGLFSFCKVLATFQPVACGSVTAIAVWRICWTSHLTVKLSDERLNGREFEAAALFPRKINKRR